jgi:hypothetical protein
MLVGPFDIFKRPNGLDSIIRPHRFLGLEAISIGMPTKIIEHLFVGDSSDAKDWPGTLICVTDELQSGKPEKAIYAPIIADANSGFYAASDGVRGVDIRMLDAVARRIDEGLEMGEDVLVYCNFGMQRSPLAVAWFLRRRRGLTLDDAYALIARLRPGVKERREALRSPLPKA